MKKLLLIALLLVALVFAVVACQDPVEEQPTDAPTAAPTDAPTDTPTDEPTAAPTDPVPTDPAPTDPVPTDPVPTDPVPTDPPPTDPPATEYVPGPWEEHKDIVVHQSFDQLMVNDTTDLFTPGQSGNWDKVATLDATATTLKYWGWVGVMGEVGQFGYQIDDQEPVYKAEFTVAAEQPVIDAAAGAGAENASRMAIYIDVSMLEGEGHAVKTLYKTTDGKVVWLCEFTLNMPNPPAMWDVDNAIVTHQSFDELKINDATGIFTPGQAANWDKIATIGKDAETLKYWGWVGVKGDIGLFGYQIDKGEIVYSADFLFAAEQGVIDAAAGTGADNATRMAIFIPVKGLEGSHRVRIFYKNTADEAVMLNEFTVKAPEPVYMDIFGQNTKLELIENWDSVYGEPFYGWGSVSSDGEGNLKLNCDATDIMACYTINGGMMKEGTPAVTGYEHLLFSIDTTNSGADLQFIFQPEVPGTGNVSTSPCANAILIYENGTVEEIAPNSYNRWGYEIPKGIKGTLILNYKGVSTYDTPDVALFATPADSAITRLGFMIVPVEGQHGGDIVIGDVYTLGSIPAVPAPVYPEITETFSSAETADLSAYFMFGQGLAPEQCQYTAAPYKISGINQLISTMDGGYALTLKNFATSNGHGAGFLRGRPDPNFGDANYYGSDKHDDPNAADASVGCAGIYFNLHEINGALTLRINVKGISADGASVGNFVLVPVDSRDLTIVDDGNTITFVAGKKIAATIAVSGSKDGFAKKAVVEANGETYTFTDLVVADSVVGSDIGFIGRAADATFDALTLVPPSAYTMPGASLPEDTHNFTSDINSITEAVVMGDSDLNKVFTADVGAGSPFYAAPATYYLIGGINNIYAQTNGTYAFTAHIAGAEHATMTGLVARGVMAATLEGHYYGDDGNGAIGGSGIYVNVVPEGDGKVAYINVKSFAGFREGDGRQTYSSNIFKVPCSTDAKITIADDGENVYVLESGALLAIISISGTHDYSIEGVPADALAEKVTVTLADGSVTEIASPAVAASHISDVGAIGRGATIYLFSIELKPFSSVEIPELSKPELPKFEHDYVADGLVSVFQGGEAGNKWMDLVGGNNVDLVVDDKNFIAADGLHLDSTIQNLPAALLDVVNGNEFTVEMKLGDFTTIGANFATIMNSANDRFALFVRMTNGELEFKFAGNPGGERIKIADGAAKIANALVTVTYKVGGEARIYINGQLAGAMPAPNAMGADNLYIGHTDAKAFATVFQSLRFYNRELTADEVVANATVDGKYQAPVANPFEGWITDGWTIEENVATGAAPAGPAQFRYNGAVPSTGLKFDVRVDEILHTIDGNTGVIYTSASGNQYFFEYNVIYKLLQVRVFDAAGAANLLAYVEGVELVTGEWYTIEAKIENGAVIMSVNGEEKLNVAGAVTEDLTGTTAHIQAYLSKVSLKNISFVELAAPAPSTDITINFDGEDLVLKELNNMDDNTGSSTNEGWGYYEMDNGTAYMCTGPEHGILSVYGWAPNIDASTLTGANYLAYDVTNLDSAAVYWAIETYNNNGAKYMISAPLVAENPVLLVTRDGVVSTAVIYDWTAAWGRVVIEIPVGFDGYFLLPTAAISETTDGATSSFDATAGLAHMGCFMTSNTASTRVFAIHGVYACEALPEVEAPAATLTFDDPAKRTEYSVAGQTWVENGITLTNTKTPPAADVKDNYAAVRLYKQSDVTIEYPHMTKIVFHCNGEKYYLHEGFITTAGTWIIDGATATLVFDEAVDKVTINCNMNQIRLDSIEVYSDASVPAATGATVLTNFQAQLHNYNVQVDASSNLNDAATINGWLGYEQAMVKAGYAIDDCNIIWVEGALTAVSADDAVAAEVNGGAFAQRFAFNVALNGYTDGTIHRVQYFVELADGNIVAFYTQSVTIGAVAAA